MTVTSSLYEKYEALKKRLHGYGRVIIAFSGGVDSSFLLKAALDSLGKETVLAGIAVSPSLGAFQKNMAYQIAEMLGITLREILLEEIHDPLYAANGPDRCFYCKSHLYAKLSEIAKQENYQAVLCGSNLDDDQDYRPGHQAAKRFGVHSPLALEQWTKKDIREMSRCLGLPTADMPASPCLATRLPYGMKITEGRLRQVEQAEEVLRKMGFAEFRVRHHDSVARIEVRPTEFPRSRQDGCREEILKNFKALGFLYVALDLAGFRSGSMNDGLPEPHKQ